jgi:hypothetical protein
MSPKDRSHSQNYTRNHEGGNENRKRTNPVIIIFLISGAIVVTAIVSSVITALILKQGNLLGRNSSTTSPSSTVAEASTALQSGNTVSLLDRECLSSTADVEQSLVKQREPKNIAIGGEVVPEIAYLFSRGGSYAFIANDQPAVVSCALNSQFRELNLVVGINGKHPKARQDNPILLEVSLDNKTVVKKELTVASKQIFNINVQNAKSLGIKAICPAPYNEICPYVSLVEASLR